jgi:hypothetical protein
MSTDDEPLFVNIVTNQPIALSNIPNADFNPAGTGASPGLVPAPGNSVNSPPFYLGDDGAWHPIRAPTVQRFTSGTAQTYTPTSSSVLWIRVRMVGGGGGGGAANTNTGTAGGTTSFGSWTAVGGAGGATNAAGNAAGGSGGTNGTGTLIARFSGQDGGTSYSATSGAGGGQSVFGGAGPALNSGVTTGISAQPNTGSGGAGASNGSNTGSSGAAGEYVEFYIIPPSVTTYTVGTGGTGGAAGAVAGGNGGAGIIVVEEFYS